MSSSSSSNKDGIDIRLALEILSQRTPTTTTTSHIDRLNNSSRDGCSCCTNHDHQQNIPPEVKSWGQRIDLYNQDDNQNHPRNDGNTKDDDIVKQVQRQSTSLSSLSKEDEVVLQQQQQSIKLEREKRQLLLQEKLHAMSITQLIHRILDCQQQRVTAYRLYDRGLEQVLKTYNMTQYPRVCAEATASFAVLSDTISSIHKEFTNRRKRTDIIHLIQQLQNNERDKLNATAAYHLECMREQQQQQHADRDNNDNNNKASNILGLLQQSIKSLKEKIQQCVNNINEVMEEIQAILVEEQEEEDVEQENILEE